MTHPLSKKELEHIEYHWFWGLRQTFEPSNQSLYHSLQYLINNDELREQHYQQQRVVGAYIAPLRFFYWVFNINNYTQRTYTLAAYEIYSGQLKKEHLMLDPYTFILGLGAAGATMYAAVKAISLWSNNSAPQDNASPIEEPPKPEPYLRVSPAMNSDLVLLGFESTVGEEISAECLNQAVKAAYRLSHPDKGGSDAYFIQVKDAVARLQAQLKDRLQPEYNAFFNCPQQQFSLCIILAERWELIAKQEQELSYEWQRLASGLQMEHLNSQATSSLEYSNEATYRAQQCRLFTLSTDAHVSEQSDLDLAVFSVSANQKYLCTTSNAYDFPITINYPVNKLETVVADTPPTNSLYSYKNSRVPVFFSASTALIVYVEPADEESIESMALLAHTNYGSFR